MKAMTLVAIVQGLVTAGVVVAVALSQGAHAAAKADPATEPPAHDLAKPTKGAHDAVKPHDAVKAHDAHEAKADDHAAPAHGAPTPEVSVEEVEKALLEGNERFVSGHPLTRDLTSRRTELAKGQHPGAMVLGCSDSRVPPEVVFDESLGDLFVVRTAGNITDPVATGSLEYAAEHLHSKVLVVLGHEKCGAVTAAAEGGELPSDNLKSVVAHITPSIEALRGHATGPELVHQGVEANVKHTVEELLQSSAILREKVSAGDLTIVSAVYDLESGKVRELH